MPRKKNNGELTRRRFIVTAGLAAAGSGVVQANSRVLIAAASDLQVVLPQIITAFRAAGGGDVAVAYGATGNLARQIRQGAPFELFLAADESFILSLARDGIVPRDGVPYARGRLALALHYQGAIAAAPDLASIADAVRRGVAFRFAIANPDHAPYGQRAMDVLVSQGLRDSLLPRLIYGETVAQAMQYVATGAAAAGLVGSSLVKADHIRDVVAVRDIPQAWHAPLIQRLVLTAKGGPGAEAFAAFMVSATARSLLAAHGFDPPH